MDKSSTDLESQPNASTAPAPQAHDGLQRRLNSRQLTMIAMGGAIGVGLFLGSSVTIELAGPGVIITYLLGALIAIVMAYSIAEMAVVHPVAGSFGIYAETYLSPWAGFTVRATYGLVQIIAIGAEVTAVAIYFGFWFPHVPGWIWVMLVSAGLVTINALQVGNFGEFEYWFALIKVVAIVAFIVVGLLLITGLGPWPAVGLANLTQHGGFLPHGWLGVWLALTLVITSYMGVEVIAVTAGEAENPSTSIPRAMRKIVYRLIIFYVLAITVMLAMTPWNRTGSASVTGSPFVRAFQTVGIPFAADANAVFVVTGTICPGMGRPSEYEGSSASRPGSLQRRHDCRDSAGRVCAEERFPSVVWNCRFRHVLCMGDDPDHPFAFSPDNQFGDTLGTSAEITRPSLAHSIRIAGLVRHCAEYVLGERDGIHGSHILAVVGRDVLDLRRLSI